MAVGDEVLVQGSEGLVPLTVVAETKDRMRGKDCTLVSFTRSHPGLVRESCKATIVQEPYEASTTVL